MINNKISIYIILYYDLDFLEDILDNIINYIDEIIIVDGPYKYCIDSLQQFNLMYNENNKPDILNKILNKYENKIKYYYNIWENEKEKRIFGYSKCNNDIILLVDCDEFFIFDINNINSFIKSDKYVASFNINNMCRININFDNETKKYIIFKKKYINEIQHLSYTWLVGVNGLEDKNINNMEINYSLGKIYHQTLNRNKKNNIIKYIFYISLYNINNNIENKLIQNYNEKELLKNINVDNDTLLNIFYHSLIELIGIPKNKILKQNNNVLINLNKYSNNHIDGFFKENTIALKNIDYYAYVNLNTNHIHIKFENVKNIKVDIYQIFINEEYNWQYFHFEVSNNEVFFNYNKYNKENLLCNIIFFNCLQTLNSDSIYKIVSINC
jgi:hypothetical protein